MKKIAFGLTVLSVIANFASVTSAKADNEDGPVTLMVQCLADNGYGRIYSDGNGRDCTGTTISQNVASVAHPKYAADYTNQTTDSGTECAVVALSSSNGTIQQKVISCIAPNSLSCDSVQLPLSASDPALVKVDYNCKYETTDQLRKRMQNDYLPK